MRITCSNTRSLTEQVAFSFPSSCPHYENTQCSAYELRFIYWWLGNNITSFGSLLGVRNDMASCMRHVYFLAHYNLNLRHPI